MNNIIQLKNLSKFYKTKKKIKVLNNINFKFTKGKICIESNKPSASVRVDNKPLSNKTELVDKTWIGVGGKLYSFVQ